MVDLIKGYVEQIEDSTVIGWAYNLNKPETSVRVQARIGEQIMEEVKADIPRNDLLAAGIGTGRHGFRMRVTPELFQLFLKGEAEIWVAATATETWNRLQTHRSDKLAASTMSRVSGAISYIKQMLVSQKSTTNPVLHNTFLIKTQVGKGDTGALALGHNSEQDFVSEQGSTSPGNSEEVHTVQTPFEISGKLFGYIDVLEADKLSGWMLATRNATTPILMVDDLPAIHSEWPLKREDVSSTYGVNRNMGFHFRYNTAPSAKAELLTFDGRSLMSAASVNLPNSGQPVGAMMIRRLIEDVAKPDAVAVTCWDGAHNPIGRAKVLYDVLDGRRPVWMFTYLFSDFGNTLWEPLKDANLRIVTIPWNDRAHYHRLLQIYDIKFPTVWLCKPRLPTFLMASAIAAPDAKLVLDFDDNEEHFSKSPGSAGKAYGGETIGLVRNLTEGIKARTAASLSLADDYRAAIVRHARHPAKHSAKQAVSDSERILRIGFVGTVRPHKRLLEAAQAIQVTGHIAGCGLQFCVYGDIKPNDYRKELEANRVQTHGTIFADDLEATLKTFDLVLTGYPSNSLEDEPITRYQITSKIGDALANGIPALVPRSRSVEDLEGIPGIFLFDRDDFSSVLMKAANYTKKIKLPEEFTTKGAYLGFKKAESNAPADSSALDLLRPAPFYQATERSVLLIWKQQDAGLYGRRIDQIARAIKKSDPDITIRVVEFMSETTLAAFQKKANTLSSEASHILQLSGLKQAGVAKSSDGIIYNQIKVDNDANASKALIDFLWLHGHTPSNTLMILFPAFALLTHLAKVLDSFPIISDIVDNQLSWGKNSTQVELIGQYVWLMRKSRHIVFNSTINRDYFKSAAFLEAYLEKKSSIVPNWYLLPPEANAASSALLECNDGKVHVIYSGNLNDRINWPLLERTAKASPELCLHIVGDGSRVTDNLKSLTDNTNVIYHGPLREDQLSFLLRKIHFAIMPHVQDEISTYMNPLKVLMYSAHGLRTVAIEVPGLNDVDGLHVVNSPDAFVAQVLVWAKEVIEGTTFEAPVVRGGMPEFASAYVDIIRAQLHSLSE